MSVFKKVIGQNQSEPQRPAPTPPDIRSAQPVEPPAPAPSFSAPSFSSQAPQPTQTQQPARSATPGTRNVLSSDVEIKGTVKFTNDLVVDGKIEGEITSDGNLTVGENARLKAEIKTSVVVVYGKVHGNITATHNVELKSTAEVVGDIKAKSLSIEAGAIFVGKSTVGTPTIATVQSAAGLGSSTLRSAMAEAAAKSAELPKQGSLLAGTNS